MMKTKLTAVIAALLILLAGCSGDIEIQRETETGQITDTQKENTRNGAEIILDGNKHTNAGYNKGGLKINFGVLGGQNLFEPGDIDYWIEITGRELDGTEATIRFTSAALKVKEKISVTLSQPDDGKRTYIGTFSAQLNGVYTLELNLEKDIDLFFSVGIVPKNEIAGDAFYFGVQPYVMRAYTWGGGYNVDGQTMEQSETSILNTVEWLGCNIIREDGVWAAMQSAENAEMNFGWMDRIIQKTQERGIVLNWLLGTAPEWAIKEEYRHLTDPSMVWSVCPVEDKWDAYVTALADRYADNGNILWEIWNEPDWEFFTGMPEDYLDLLERTARIFRSRNPGVLLYPGGLTVANDPNDYRYKDSRPYFAGFKRLLDEGLIDTYSIHIHGLFDDYYFFDTLNEMTKQIEAAGLDMSGIYNTEAGLYETDQDLHARHLMAKILYTRGHDYKMYVQYSFRAFPADGEDGWAMFDTYLQPKRAAIAYAALIGKLGQSEKTGTISDDRSLYADIYYDGSQSVVTVFNDGTKSGKLTPP
ncbi:MAG: hypothetical protein PHZ09_14370 [Eubacteriales bacterium]|nr:hypothetical protein [Eubacteriales bacterium]